MSWRPGDPLTLERERQDAARDKVLEFTREQRSCDVKNSWLQRSDHQFLRRTVDRRVRAAVAHRETHVDQRRRRFVHCCTVTVTQFINMLLFCSDERVFQR